MTESFDPDVGSIMKVGWHDLSRSLPPLELPSNHRVLVVSPHPDDETLGCGGLISDLATSGVDVVVLVASDGAASHPGVSLASVRAQEAQNAVEALGLWTKPTFAGLPDGRLHEHVGEMSDIIGGFLAEGDLLIGPIAGDGHSDHDAVAAAVDRAVATVPPGTVETLAYGIWIWTTPPSETLLRGARRFTVSRNGLKAKRTAINCYSTQVTKFLGKQIVTDDLLSIARQGVEVYW